MSENVLLQNKLKFILVQNKLITSCTYTFFYIVKYLVFRAEDWRKGRGIGAKQILGRACRDRCARATGNFWRCDHPLDIA